MGKTRLLRETIRYLNASGTAWQAGFSDRDTMSQNPTSLKQLFSNDRPLFIVLDYAETQTELLMQLLQIENAQNNVRTTPVRVVLLARTADTWWEQSRLQSQRADLPQGATELTPLNEAREASFKRALKAFAMSDDNLSQIPVPDLSAESFRRVLYIHMRALLALRTQGQPASEEDLLDQIMQLEKEQWLKEPLLDFSLESQVKAIEQIMTVVTLGYALQTPSDLKGLLGMIPYTRHIESEAKLDELCTRLRELYPSPTAYLELLRPDILGEHLVESTLLPKDIDAPEPRKHLLSLAFDRANSQPDAALEALLRLMQRREQSGIRLLSEVYSTRKENVSLAKIIALQFPVTLPGSLRQQAVEAGSLALENADNDIERATFANNLSVDLGLVGRREEALTAIEEAVSTYRRLAEVRPEAFLPDLAMSLNNLSTELEALGREKEALQVQHEAVSILSPFFLKLPLAYAQWMQVMVRVYIDLCENSGQAPDEALLTPIINVFEALQNQSENDG